MLSAVDSSMKILGRKLQPLQMNKKKREEEKEGRKLG
jgi:hypothetical protein